LTNQSEHKSNAKGIITKYILNVTCNVI